MMLSAVIVFPVILVVFFCVLLVIDITKDWKSNVLAQMSDMGKAVGDKLHIPRMGTDRERMTADLLMNGPGQAGDGQTNDDPARPTTDVLVKSDSIYEQEAMAQLAAPEGAGGAGTTTGNESMNMDDVEIEMEDINEAIADLEIDESMQE